NGTAKPLESVVPTKGYLTIFHFRTTSNGTQGDRVGLIVGGQFDTCKFHPNIFKGSRIIGIIGTSVDYRRSDTFNGWVRLVYFGIAQNDQATPIPSVSCTCRQ